MERRGAEVCYVKTDNGFEVDFLVRYPGAGTELLQVCADVRNPETLARELSALTEATKTYPRATQRLLVLDRDALSGVNAPGVVVQPAYEWLLETMKPASVSVFFALVESCEMKAVSDQNNTGKQP